MTGALHIPHWSERLVVRAADAVLAPLSWLPRRAPAVPRRVLLLRLERIGDLLMVIDAIRQVRTRWPDAELDLAVGDWNLPLALLLPEVTRVETLNVPWLARGEAGHTWLALVARARRWRSRRYDLIINFEPDLRSNALAWIAGAPVRVGYSSGGGGALLTDARPYDVTSHVAANAEDLVARAARLIGPPPAAQPADRQEPRAPRLRLPDAARADARRRFAGAGRPLVGIHASGGRPSKQWHPERFAAVATRLQSLKGATIVLTGGPGDRTLADAVGRMIGDGPVINTAGAAGLVESAALLAELDLLVTGDTGPMHLAAAVGTPVVALFGPSDPARYGPRASRERVLHADVACRPCGRVRLPPARCRGHVPDCLDGIAVEQVVQAALDLLVPVAAAPAPIPGGTAQRDSSR